MRPNNFALVYPADINLSYTRDIAQPLGHAGANPHFNDTHRNGYIHPR